MVILSATDGHILTDLPIGVGCDGATFNPATMEAFSSQGDGTLTVIKESSPTSFAAAPSAETTTPCVDWRTDKIRIASSRIPRIRNTPL